MIWPAIITGALIIALILAGILTMVASDLGWRFALVVFGIAISVTALAALASLLIGYGIEGHL